MRRGHTTGDGDSQAAAVTATIRAMVATLPENLLGRRNRALLLGFAAALRRSEQVGLDVADLAFTRDGMVLTLRRSTTDQEGQGRGGIPAAHLAGCLFNTDDHVNGHRFAIDRLQHGFKLRPVPALNLISHKNVRRPEDNMIAIPQQHLARCDPRDVLLAIQVLRQQRTSIFPLGNYLAVAA